MAAVLHYNNLNGENKQNVWRKKQDAFRALIKCYVQQPGDLHPKVIEKPSTRPATIEECCRYASRLRKEYGPHLKQLIVWDMDQVQETAQSLGKQVKLG
ncbi:hypothetical protein [Bacillus infantis]|uniref:hypothetical protein n=1 Tax=Bacillus infantis TaxID=324767 RepID=UPI00321B7E42